MTIKPVHLFHLLLDHCRRDVTRLEKLLAIVSTENEKTFKQFEPFLRAAYDDPLLVESPVKTDLSRLFASLREWKLIHHHSQDLLNEIEKPFDFLTLYKFHKADFLLEQALLAWDKLQVSKLRDIPEKWSLQHANSLSLNQLPEKTLAINKVAERLINEVSPTDFKLLYRQFNEFRGILWDVLQTSDDNIKGLIEKIVIEIGV